MENQEPASHVHLAAIFFVCLLLYGWTLTFGFIWDDMALVNEGVIPKSLREIPRMFSTDLWDGVAGIQSKYYRPLPQILSAIDYALWGTTPAGYHLTNVVLHCGVALTVYLCALQLFGAAMPAFWVALVYAVHPAHAETVAWAGARTELLPALFMFLAIYAHLRFRSGNSWRWLVAGLVFAWGALLSKEMAVTLPLLIILAAFARKGRLKDECLWGLPYFLLLIPYFMIRAMVLSSQGISRDHVLERIYTSFGIYAGYFRQLILPYPARVCYDMPVRVTAADPLVFLPAIFLLVIIALAFFFWNRQRWISFGLFWVLIALLPVSGLPVIIRPFAMANRYLYIPAFGFAVAAGSLLLQSDWLAGKKQRSSSMVLLLAMVLAVATGTRLHFWRDDPTYYAKCAEDVPESAMTQMNLGGIKLKQKRFDEAAIHLAAAFRLDPDNPNLANNYAYALMENGELQRAAAILEKLEKENPDLFLTRFNLGTLYLLEGAADKALAEFSHAARIQPHRPQPYLRMGGIYLEQKNYPDAERNFREALARNPQDMLAALNGLGSSLLGRGKLTEAREVFGRALKIQGDNPIARKGLLELEATENHSPRRSLQQ